MVYSTAMRITGDPHESQDIAQKVFVQAWGRLDELLGHENQGGWFRLSARNLSINHVKRHTWRFLPLGDRSDPADTGSERCDWLFDTREQLKHALDSLPRAQRAVIALHYYEDLPYEEVAESLGCTVAKVKTDLFRARARLKDKLRLLEEHA